MSRILSIAVVLIVTLAAPVIAQEGAQLDSEDRLLLVSDQTADRATIESQLQAFRREDGKAAFTDTAPLIQNQFRSAENFMSMVRQSYLPVYQPRTVRFGNVAAIDGWTVWRLHVVGPDGFGIIALYMMQCDPTARGRSTASFSPGKLARRPEIVLSPIVVAAAGAALPFPRDP